MRCMIVAPTWLLMSSPTIGTPASANFCGPLRVAGDEHRDGVDERRRRRRGTPARSACCASSEPTGQVGHEHVGARVAQDLRDVDRLRSDSSIDLAVVLAEPVERVAALHRARRVGGTSANRIVLFGSAKIASATSMPTFFASTSKAATISMSRMW